MPGAPAPFTDPWAPPQYVAGNTGAAGPLKGLENLVNNSSYDTTLSYKLAGTIILALTTVFVLQQLGFRFVVAAGVGR